MMNYIIRRYKTQISKGNLERPLREMERISRDSKWVHDQVTQLSGMYYSNEKENRVGVLDNSNYQVILNKVTIFIPPVFNIQPQQPTSSKIFL